MAKPADLLERITETPHLARVVPRLRPEVLHRVIEACGLEQCADLVALATPAQLTRVFDLDLWRSERPGLDETLDGARFGVWLEVLNEAGAEVAADKVAGIDADLVAAALAQHVLVFDRAAIAAYETLDGDEIGPKRHPGALVFEIGNAAVEATRTDAWEAIVDLLRALEARHPRYLHRLMEQCRSLSEPDPEIDGLDELPTAAEQIAVDIAGAREQRRDTQGYVTPAQARAFLRMARQPAEATEAATLPDPISAAYFRAIEAADASVPDDSAAENAAVLEVLLDAGVVGPEPVALLEGLIGDGPRLAHLHTQLQSVRALDHAAAARRAAEFAYLVNTIVSGCSIQSRAFTLREASEAAAAVCNLGLENWPSPAPLSDDFLVHHDLIGVFRAGWTRLHADVVMDATARLVRMLGELRGHDRDVQDGVNRLRRALETHARDDAPWRARRAFDVLLLLDTAAWAALLGIIDECPVMHAAVDASRRPGTRAIDAADFSFISENRQIAAIHEFLETLPAALSS